MNAQKSTQHRRVMIFWLRAFKDELVVPPVPSTNIEVVQENMNDNKGVPPVPPKNISRVDDFLPTPKTAIPMNPILGVTGVTGVTQLNLKDKLGATQSVAGVTGVTKPEQPVVPQNILYWHFTDKKCVQTFRVSEFF